MYRIINFIDQFKIAEQNKLIHKLYDTDSISDSISLEEANLRMLMIDTLYICLGYRNKAAHGGRIYNYNCPNVLRVHEIFGDSFSFNVNGFSQLLFVLSLLDYQSPYIGLQDILNEEVNRHCSKYPQDVTYLGQILNLDIISQTIVYVSNSSNKYHLIPHCSGIKNTVPLVLEEAKAQNYVPCKRCAKRFID